MKSDATCQTCKHWEVYTYEPNEWTVPNKEMSGKGTCEKTRTIKGYEVPGTLAYASGDAEGYGVLITYPLFGCNQHEPIDSEI